MLCVDGHMTEKTEGERGVGERHRPICSSGVAIYPNKKRICLRLDGGGWKRKKKKTDRAQLSAHL